jgi:soluble lytic murein transglycosylase-like protein
MKEPLILESLAACEASARAIPATAAVAEPLDGALRLARRTILAVAVGGSLAVLVAPGLPAREAAVAPEPARPTLLGTNAPAPAPPDPIAGGDMVVEAADSRSMLFAAVTRCRPSLPEGQRWRIADAVYHESARHGYDPLFVMALVEVESTCSPTANSPRGAVGLTQIKPSTAREVAKDLGVPWGGRSSLVQPRLNVRLGLSYLSELERKFGDPYVAMAAYNLGPRRVARMSRQTAKHARYVKKVLARYEGLLVEHAV